MESDKNGRKLLEIESCFISRIALEETLNVCSSDSFEGSSSERSIKLDSTKPTEIMAS